MKAADIIEGFDYAATHRRDWRAVADIIGVRVSVVSAPKNGKVVVRLHPDERRRPYFSHSSRNSWSESRIGDGIAEYVIPTSYIRLRWDDWTILAAETAAHRTALKQSHDKAMSARIAREATDTARAHALRDQLSAFIDETLNQFDITVVTGADSTRFVFTGRAASAIERLLATVNTDADRSAA